MKTIGEQFLELAPWEHEPRDSRGQWTRGDSVIEKVTEPIGMEGARGDSREVSHAEFQQMAAEGRVRLRAIQGAPWSTGGMHRNWGAIKQRTWDEVQKPWGGATIDPRTGDDLPQGADKFAMSIKPTGLDTTSVSEHASRAEFSQAMDIALAKYGKQLSKGGSYLGVFHDDDLGRIDIDPVTVLNSLREVETIGAYTHAIGGAYRFSDGNGYWPPHVAEGAALGNSGHHWAGPGEWHRHATNIQDPHDEPEDQDENDAPGSDLARDQVINLELGWRDAWRHELRGPHGEWVSGVESLRGDRRKPDPDITRQLSDLNSAAENRFGPEYGDTFSAKESYARGDMKGAAVSLRLAAADYGVAAADAAKYNALADRLDPPVTDPGALHELLSKAGLGVPGMFGPDEHLDWDGKPPTVYPDGSRGGAVAEMDWNGHMAVRQSVAHSIAADQADPGSPVQNAADYEVPLHELVHAVIPAGQSRETNGDKQAYQGDMAKADIEEGFTELGAILHAHQFFDSAGIGGRKAPDAGNLDSQRLLAKLKGEPFRPDMSAGKTMDDLADEAAVPEKIRGGDAWGHYPVQTAQAFEWASMMAQMRTGKGETDPATKAEIQDISDKVNAVGTAQKLPVMAMETIGDMLPADRAQAQQMLQAAARAIRDQFAVGTPEKAPARARAVARQMMQEEAERTAA